MRGGDAGTVRFRIQFHRRLSVQCVVMALLCLLFYSQKGLSQEEPKYIEISTFFSVSNVGGKDIPALINDNVVYLAVAEVFDFLKIKNTRSPSLDSVSGFFMNPQAVFLFDRAQNRIEYNGKTFDLHSDDLIKTDNNLYLRIEYFGRIFGLDCKYSFRSLSVTLTTQIELPSIREMRQAQVRNSVNQNKTDVKTDTIIHRNYPIFSLGMADWQVISTQQNHGRSDTRFNLSLGSIFLGGETNVNLNYNSNEPFTEKRQDFRWRGAKTHQG